MIVEVYDEILHIETSQRFPTSLGCQCTKGRLEGRCDVLTSRFIYDWHVKELSCDPASLFIHMSDKHHPLEAEDIHRAFRVSTLSVEGSNRRRMEARTIGFWKDWLQTVEVCHRTTENPCGGLSLTPTKLNFLHPEDGHAQFPTANTCVFVLRLPVFRQSEKFQEAMENGISWARLRRCLAALQPVLRRVAVAYAPVSGPQSSLAAISAPSRPPPCPGPFVPCSVVVVSYIVFSMFCACSCPSFCLLLFLVSPCQC
ncbi:hypothetical protein F7725_009950 [Dissostichus mawsoni]|uniref:HECT domain-containing protein n=1 Tax=Dissostichus mawsoni TaxID=36200 RepID=A0A7J5XM64_DISMA|nr:hypothetical protein F7725_009950 [Dissostichus mawsoni]